MLEKEKEKKVEIAQTVVTLPRKLQLKFIKKQKDKVLDIR